MIKLDILPTPQHISAVAASSMPLVTGLKTFYADPSVRDSIAVGLRFLPPMTSASSREASLILTCSPSLTDRSWFKHPNAQEQGYIIREQNGQIIISACTSQGLLYGIATLIQLPTLQPGFVIKDYPSIRYRANKWLIWAETEIWSFDHGDGYDAVLARVIRKLDVCLKYKVNMVFFDGWGTDPERTPNYTALMRQCNREAEKRGIRLIFGAYTSGYGLSGHQVGKHFGSVFMNRKSYPDGKIYPCLGTFIHDRRNNGIPHIKGREYGTCLSNEALLEEKLKELCRFVRDIQPGALYLHNMDSCLIDQRFWLARCEDCRQRWPSDDLFAADGMAGAFAYFFDRLNGALKQEKEDLILFNVAPGYMEYKIDDDAVVRAAEFWQAVQRYSKIRDGVYPLFRELFYNKEHDGLRIPALAQRVRPFGIINFSGSDGFYSDQPVNATAAFYKMFQGTEVLISASGNYFQEPLQLINAEYMWNPAHSAFYNAEDLPIGYHAFMPFYRSARTGSYRPEGIFGAGGLLDIVCQKLYGAAAPQMSAFFKLRGKNGECPVLYPCNKELGTAANSVLLDYRWDNPLTEKEQMQWEARFEEILALNRQGLALLEQVQAQNVDAAELQRLLMINQPMIRLLLEYLKLYRHMDRHFREHIPAATLIPELDALHKSIQQEREAFSALGLEPVDAMGGAFCRRQELIDVLESNLILMNKSLQTGQRIPKDHQALKDEDWW